MTDDPRAAYVLSAIGEWLKEAKAIKYVPWVLKSDCAKYDALKAGEQNGRNIILHQIETVIAEAKRTLENSVDAHPLSKFHPGDVVALQSDAQSCRRGVVVKIEQTLDESVQHTAAHTRYLVQESQRSADNRSNIYLESWYSESELGRWPFVITPCASSQSPTSSGTSASSSHDPDAIRAWLDKYHLREFAVPMGLLYQRLCDLEKKVGTA